MCLCVRRLWCIADFTGQRWRTAPAPGLLLDHRRHRKSATFPVYIRRLLPVGVALPRTSCVLRADNAGTLVCSTSPLRTRPLLPLLPEPEMVMWRTATGRRGSQWEPCVGATPSSARNWTPWKPSRSPDTVTRWSSVVELTTDKGPCSCLRLKLSGSRYRRVLKRTSMIKRTCFCCSSQVSPQSVRCWFQERR